MSVCEPTRSAQRRRSASCVGRTPRKGRWGRRGARDPGVKGHPGRPLCPKGLPAHQGCPVHGQGAARLIFLFSSNVRYQSLKPKNESRSFLKMPLGRGKALRPGCRALDERGHHLHGKAPRASKSEEVEWILSHKLKIILDAWKHD